MILDRIVASKKAEVEERKKQLPLETMVMKIVPGEKRPFAKNLKKPGKVSLIAEIKKASPSKGIIRQNFDPLQIAQSYANSGASALSVLTDYPFFQGKPEYLAIIRNVVTLPLLRKDFIIDPYQVYEARLLGADAILLIMAILTDREAFTMMETARELGLEYLVEVHDREELLRAQELGANLIGINNRNLKTFKTQMETTFRLREMIINPDITVVSESGINTRKDVLRLQEYGIDAMLVGEALMRENDIEQKVQELMG